MHEAAGVYCRSVHLGEGFGRSAGFGGIKPLGDTDIHPLKEGVISKVRKIAGGACGAGCGIWRRYHGDNRQSDSG